MTSSTPRTSETHRSRIARRLDRETGMGYQKALTTVREQAEDLTRQLHLEHLDAGGCDLMLRGLLQQDIECWGPGIGAHLWPSAYHPLSISMRPAPMCPEALQMANRIGWEAMEEQPEPCGTFDPAWLAEAGVEALVDDAPDYDEDEEEIAPELLEPMDEPDRWKRHVLAQGPRPAFRLPSKQSLPSTVRTQLQQLGPDQTRARLEQVEHEQPAAVETYVLRAELALGHRAATADAKLSSAALAEARKWYECAVAVGEMPLQFFHGGALLWREEANRPFLRALYGLALVAFHQGRANASEEILFSLLYLNPHDEQDAAGLLFQVRRSIGLPAPVGTSR